MDRLVETKSIRDWRFTRNIIVALLCLGLFPSHALAETCMTDALMMVDETVEVPAAAPVRKAKKRIKTVTATTSTSKNKKIASNVDSSAMAISGTKISHAHVESSR